MSRGFSALGFSTDQPERTDWKERVMARTQANITRAPSRMRFAVISLLGTLFVCGASGCENALQGGATGAGLGALAGMALGSMGGNMGKGAVVGAVTGAALGGILGDQNRRRDSGD